MAKKELRFAVNQLIVEERNPSLRDFDSLKDDDLEKFSIVNVDEKKEEILSIKKIKKIVFEERFVAILFEGGERYPYPEKVINSELNEVDNPRSSDEIELDEQFFALIDINTARVLISDQRKKNMLLNWLKDKLKKRIDIKPLMAEEDFVEKIKSISEISFAVEPNLLNSYNAKTLSSELANDIFGFGAEEAVIKMIYKNKKINEKIIEKIKSLFERKSDFKSITVIGRTAEDFESIFNISEIINKIFISVDVNNSTQKFDHNEVFESLISKIKQNEKTK